MSVRERPPTASELRVIMEQVEKPIATYASFRSHPFKCQLTQYVRTGILHIPVRLNDLHPRVVNTITKARRAWQIVREDNGTLEHCREMLLKETGVEYSRQSIHQLLRVYGDPAPPERQAKTQVRQWAAKLTKDMIQRYAAGKVSARDIVKELNADCTAAALKYWLERGARATR